jgi:2,4-dienoyl-CoA reductase-like NADH-dependent reductase (Old Yellow Enzyme family)
MTESDIADVIAAFARSAEHARELGFDGVELHGAHGYLIDQFFWSTANQRSDRYGGGSRERLRFALEIVRAVRASVGASFPVCFRLSQFKLGDYRFRVAPDATQLEQWVGPLGDAGVDVFHCSTRRFDEPEFEGSPLNLAGWVKRLTGKPTITVGSVGLDSDFIASFAGRSAGVHGIERLLERLARGEFDLVAIGRAQLADAEWPEKIRTGRFAEVTSFVPEHLSRYP